LCRRSLRSSWVRQSCARSNLGQYDRLERGRRGAAAAPLDIDLAIKRRALLRVPAKALYERVHAFGRQFLAVLVARSTRNAFVHERAAQIVGACVEASGRALGPELDPGGLDIFDQGMQRQ